VFCRIEIRKNHVKFDYHLPCSGLRMVGILLNVVESISIKIFSMIVTVIS